MAFKSRISRGKRTMRKRPAVRRRRAIAKKGVFVKKTGMPSLQCNPRVNRASRHLTLTSKVNNRFGTSVVPSKFFTTMPYYDSRPIILSSTNINQHLFRMNSIFDPDLTGGGHQPRGHDEMAQLYQGYQVYGVAYQIVFTTRDTSRETFQCGVLAAPNNFIGFGSIQDAHEHTQSRIRWVTLDDQRPIAKIQGYFNCSNAQQVSKKDYSTGDEFKAGFGSNPSVSPILCIVGHTLDGTTSTQGVDCSVNLLYYVKCELPQPLGPS